MKLQSKQWMLAAILFASINVSAQTKTRFDSAWEFSYDGKTISVDVPHDWAIAFAPDPATGASGTDGGWYPGGKGKYRKKFATPKGEIVKLHFEGVYQRATVTVNGRKAGQHAYGYTPFTVDVTPYLNHDKRPNEVVVDVDNSEQPNCRWYTGSGIYRHVWLETMPALHLAENGVFVTTPEVSSDSALVKVEATVENESDCDRNALVAIGAGQMMVSVPARRSKTVSTSFVIRNPHLWSPDDPYRYQLNAELKENGKVIHRQTVDYGIRSCSFDAERGFVLNGQPLLINGACVHHDDGVLGAMAFDAAEVRKVRQMKEAGFNLIRTSHNPTTRALLDACDSIGMLVIGEVFDGWRTAWDADWEIYDPHFDVLDIGGYNYMIFKHATDHQRNPKRVMWQTESFPRDAFKNWQLVHDYPYIVGDIVWTGLDYLGESGIGRNYYEGERPGEHWVEGGMPEWHGAYCGDVDITGWRKPISHYREILWNDSDDLYMAVREPDGYHGKINMTSWSVYPTWESWNWPKWKGKPIEVEVYTKAPEVTLYLNDKEVGRQKVDRSTEFKAVFSVPYEEGTLCAKAGGKSVTLSTAGEPARIRLTADRSVISADGQDLAFITLEVVDREGRVCPDAAIPCEAIVEGQGKMMAFATADLKDREPKTSPRVTTWKGRALLVVRGSQSKGKAQVTIKSSLPTATMTIKAK